VGVPGQSGPEPLEKILRRTLRRAPLSGRTRREKVQRAWAAAAAAAGTATGPDLVRRTRVGDFRRGVLRVRVESSTLLAELVAFRRAGLLEALQRNTEGLLIHELRFELGEAAAGGDERDAEEATGKGS